MSAQKEFSLETNLEALMSFNDPSMEVDFKNIKLFDFDLGVGARQGLPYGVSGILKACLFLNQYLPEGSHQTRTPYYPIISHSKPCRVQDLPLPVNANVLPLALPTTVRGIDVRGQNASRNRNPQLVLRFRQDFTMTVFRAVVMFGCSLRFHVFLVHQSSKSGYRSISWAEPLSTRLRPNRTFHKTFHKSIFVCGIENKISPAYTSTNRAWRMDHALTFCMYRWEKE